MTPYLAAIDHRRPTGRFCESEIGDVESSRRSLRGWTHCGVVGERGVDLL
jgi:hypothetical protein